MKNLSPKLKKTILTGVLLLSQINYAATFIKAEETAFKYIKATEIVNDRYIFEECHGNREELKCRNLFSDYRTFARSDIKKMADMNGRHALYAAGADVAILAVSAYLGLIIGAKATAAYYIGTGVSLDGGVAAAGGFFFGAPTGTAAASAMAAGLDELDPFVHRDMSIALEQVIGVADEDDLDDVEAQRRKEGMIVEIEDINFDQLKNKIKGQLEDLD
ncbi:hypothetical protein [Halobacteriovorax sp. YZS-1-1]|uniref:hypothetical protein n=1 Tax=unclassified Halobacteriovorax TaxID=2639665 RepID=UPI00399ADF9D